MTPVPDMRLLSQEHAPDHSPDEQAVQCVTDTSAFTYSLQISTPFEIA